MTTRLDDLRMILREAEFRGLILLVPSGSDVVAIASAFADTLSGTTRLIELVGPYLRTGESWNLLQPLLTGETLVLAAPGGDFAPLFAERWPEWLEYRAGGLLISVTHNLTFEPSLELAAPGILVAVVPQETKRPRIRRALEYYLDVDEARTLERAAHRKPDATIGAGGPKADVTTRQLCLLHAQDPPGTPKQSLSTILNERSDMITWTDLKVLVVGSESENPWMLDYLQKHDRIDEQKWAFGRAAIEFLEERTKNSPRGGSVAVYENIWEVMWSYQSLDTQKRYIFRGQVSSNWALVPSLFRPVDALPPDMGTLLDRIDLTERFVGELRRRAQEFLGGDATDEELLAIAQHYGFATPLLDFSRSLAIAGFFATNRKAGAFDDTIGIIYYMTSARSELSSEQGLKERLTIGNFSLLDAARLHFGDIHVIEPHLHDADNRIARQQGVFIGGYQVRDLQEIAIDRLYFRQRPGEIFEDPSRGITAAHLLPPDSPIEELASDLRAHAQGGRRRRFSAGLASARIPGNPVIGSQGALLFSQVRDAGKFLDALRESHNVEMVDAIADIFDRYFAAARARADVNEAPDAHSSSPGVLAISTAVDALADLTGTDRDRLWATIFDELVPGPAEEVLGKPTGTPLELTTAGEDERLAVACALFLAAWEHLQFIRGSSARRLLMSASLVLRGYGVWPA